MRLAYHGMRAKNKDFSVFYGLKLDPDLPEVAQEFGRVLIKVIINAFQAVKEQDNAIVVLTTKSLGDGVEIEVSDNSPGIPKDAKDKIFQPFFATKAAGKGTGLGLSLRYDIVKAHDGEPQVKTNSEAGSTFFMTSPMGT